MCQEVPTPARKRYRDLAPRPPEGDLNLGALVPGDGPLEIDVGFGHGLSLFERSTAAPEARLLGIEIKSKLAYLVDQRRQRMGLDRVRVLCGDAREILHRAGPAASVARVFLHFPDPWWKKRHQKRRVLQSDLLDDVARLLRPAGELYIQTDVRERAEEYRVVVRAHPAFALPGEGRFLDRNPFSAPSNRERRAEEDGLPVFRLLAHRP